MIDFEKVGRKILLYRRKQNISQDDLAAKMFVTRQLVSKWENGTGVPKIDHVIDLCEIFQVSVEDLLCLNDRMEDEEL